jgi:hypothetical protein
VITVNPTTLTNPVVGTAYSTTITASGGTAPYTYTVTSGTLPAGLTLSTGGVLSGTATSTASQTFMVTATDANTCMGTRSYTVTPSCPTITLTPATLTNPVVGTAYSTTITSSGGTAPYSYTVSTGVLPAGLSLSAGGVISGTATSTATATFTVRATDNFGCQGTQSYTVTPPCPTITLTPTSLANGTVGIAYSQTVTATGGTAPYSYTVSAGTLPAGLSLSTAGLLSGTPTASNGAGVSVTIRAQDAYGCFSTRVYNVRVCPAITVSPTTLTNPVVGTAYSATITSTGGAGTITYAITSGSLPAGLTLTTGGVLSGTATSTTSQTFTVTATDVNTCVGTRSYTLAPTCPTITVAPATLPNGNVGTAYTQTVTASGGTAPYTWTVNSGTLPAGLSLSSAGVISGTPTTVGVSTFVVRAMDSYGCTGLSASFTVSVANPTTDFGDYSVFGAATQATSTALRIGTAATDAEITTPANATATGDDTTGTDDEDLTMPTTTPGSATVWAGQAGNSTLLTMPAFTVGNATTLNIPVTLTSPVTAARLNVWADWNGDGDVLDTNETQTVQSVTSSGTRTFSLTPPKGTIPGTKYLRIRLTDGSTAPAFSGTSTLAGEVEDYAITVLPEADYGDFSLFAPAWSTLSNSVRMGAAVDSEPAMYNSTATSDDFGVDLEFDGIAESLDDEDGIRGVNGESEAVRGGTQVLIVNVTNTSGVPAYLNGWVDWNNNGVLTDAGEQFFTDRLVPTGTSGLDIPVSVNVPSNAALQWVSHGIVGVRTRLSTVPNPGSTGAAGTGEVEDHTAWIVDPYLE